jgi:hypothetical protein
VRVPVYVCPCACTDVYVKVGRNDVFAPEPSVIHFRGFTPGQVHSASIRVVNVTDVSQRLDILQPDTPHFKLRLNPKGKRGLVAPGMAEVVTVEFRPVAYDYYHDAIRLHSPSANLLVPIHAYPVLSTKQLFPSRIDLGNCPVGHSVKRIVRLASTIPLAFQFEFQCIRSGDFAISPMVGVVPAADGVDIVVEYTPQRPVTGSAQYLFNCSQFGFKPFTCELVGSAVQPADPFKCDRCTAPPSLCVLRIL